MLSFFSRNDSDTWGDKIREGDAEIEIVDLDQDEETVHLNLTSLGNNIRVIKKINYLSYLARGSYSVVYLAELVQKNGSKKICVLKELVSKPHDDRFRQKDFSMDLEVTRELKTSLDQNILKLIQSFNINLEVLSGRITRSFGVFPYCNLFLDKYLQKNSRPEFDEIKKIMRDLIKALYYLHNEKKIIHCDINPQNIALYEDKKGNKRWCLTDFGSALHVGENKESMGALYYRCPASFLDYRFSSYPSNDIYALGQVLKLLLNISDAPKNETPRAFSVRKRSEQVIIQDRFRRLRVQRKKLVDQLKELGGNASDFDQLKLIADAMTDPTPQSRPTTEELRSVFGKKGLNNEGLESCFFASRKKDPASPKRVEKSLFGCLFSSRKTPVRKISVVPAPGVSG